MANRNKDILRKNRILGYRRKKNLCLKCGKEKDHFGDCVESYQIVDNRLNKIEKSKIVLSKPEEKKKITLLKTKEIILQRPFIILDLSLSRYGNIIEFNCLNYISKKYNDFIISIFDNAEKHFSVFEMIKIKKMTNIFNIEYISLQEKINFLYSCKCLFSFPSQFTNYSKDHNIPFYLFDENKNSTCILKNVPDLSM